MNKFIGPAIVVVLVVVGYMVYANSIAVTSQSSTSVSVAPTGQDVATESVGSSTKDAIVKDDKMMMGRDSDQQDKMGLASYTDYTKDKYMAAVGKQRVLFFHAGWCPTCKAANAEFETSTSNIPSDVVLFKTDYDTESELKAKYNITYQHTYVLVDQNDKELKKWNGGGLAELIENTKI